MHQAAGSLEDIIDARAKALAAAIPALAGTLASIDPHDHANRLVGHLTSHDAGDANDAARVVLNLAWPCSEPPPEWSATPLGRLVVLASPRSSVPLSVAGRVLGVSRQRAGRLAQSGRLTRHPAGGVTLESLRALAETRACPAPATESPEGANQPTQEGR